MFNDLAVRIPIGISLGAIAGALSRYYITLWFSQRFGTAFPYGTFFINISGCFIMGFLATLVAERVRVPPELVFMGTTGFLGAYTTFSTYGLDTVNLLRQAAIVNAGLYWAGSAILGTIAIQLGSSLARMGR